MDQTIIEKYREFLKSQNHQESTVRNYSKIIEALDNPPVCDDLKQLLIFIDDTYDKEKEILNERKQKFMRAALNSFFYMNTGITVKEYRKQCIQKDIYDYFLIQYADYCSKFLNLSSAVTHASVREVKRFLKAVTNDPYHTDWATITAKNIISYLKTMRSDITISSVGVTVTAIRRFFRFLKYKDYCIDSSVLTLPLSTPNWSKYGKLPVTLSSEDTEKIDNYLFADSPIGIRNQAILFCFTELGLRCSEVANLQFNDIKWNTGTIVIRKTKTHSERELPLSKKLGTALEKYVIQSRSPNLGSALFYKSKYRTNEPASTENIRMVIRGLFSKNGIKGKLLGTHALRRTFASSLYNKGNSLKTVADLLGHSSVSATTAYVRIDIESLRTVASEWPRRDSNE